MNSLPSPLTWTFSGRRSSWDVAYLSVSTEAEEGPVIITVEDVRCKGAKRLEQEKSTRRKKLKDEVFLEVVKRRYI